MLIYLPVAGMAVNALWILGLGGLVGFLSGLFGVGGGFVMTPLLILLGVPPAVAVGTQANQLVGASVSGVLAHWRRRNVDIKMGIVMLIGGVAGTALGVAVFGVLQRLGHIDVVIRLSYVLLLGGIGSLMLAESVRTLWRRRGPSAGRGKLHRHGFLHRLPLKTRFPASRLYISALLPFGIGFVGGALVAIMGVGGGFLLVPAMIYLLNMPSGLVAGTSLFQIIFTTAAATILQAATNGTVDVVLAILLLIGGVIGAPLGTRAGVGLRGEHSRVLLALLVVAVAAKLGWDVALTPADLYSIGIGGMP
jgi:uncharacterized protein